MAEFSSQGKEYWKVIKITGERAKTYQIEWAGTDPETGKPWPLDWVPKEDVTPDLVDAWEEKKEKREEARKGEVFVDSLELLGGGGLGRCARWGMLYYGGVVSPSPSISTPIGDLSSWDRGRFWHAVLVWCGTLYCCGRPPSPPPSPSLHQTN